MKTVSRGFLATSLFLGVGILGCGDNPVVDGGPGDDVGNDVIAPTNLVLDPPRQGEGFQIKTPEFVVPPGMEIQDCYFIAMPNEETWVSRIQMAQLPGTHHMNLFRLGTKKALWGAPGDVVRGGECWRAPNWADWGLISNSQQSEADRPVNNWELPAGVGMKFEPGEVIMLQTHYVNATTQASNYGKGQVFVNFYTKPKADFQHELGTLFATNQGIEICPGETNKFFEATCNFARDQELTVIAANSHFHSRGTYFNMAMNDPDNGTVGAPFYENRDWEDPLWKTDLNVKIPKNGGIQYRCEYAVPADACGNINDNCCFSFGGFVETQEHCNIFVYYYPKIASQTVCY